MAEKQKIHHEIRDTNIKMYYDYFFCLVIETTWGDPNKKSIVQRLFFLSGAVDWWNFSRLFGQEKVMMWSRQWREYLGYPRYSSGEKRDWDMFFMVEVGKIWKLFLEKKYTYIFEMRFVFDGELRKIFGFSFCEVVWNDFVERCHLFLVANCLRSRFGHQEYQPENLLFVCFISIEASKIAMVSNQNDDQ